MRRSFTITLLIGLTALVSGAEQAGDQDSADLNRRVTELTILVEKLQARISELETKVGGSTPPESAAVAVPLKPTAREQTASVPPNTPAGNFLRDTTVNFLFDGYYDFNFNKPIGRVSLLRAYDVVSDAFSLNQADLVFENAADPENGKRFGLRIDLQYGEATETLQGNPANEPRPDIYRNIFQAYGTYVFPIGTGLTVDFGKFASSIGIEGNYTKDQMNYSRSFWFDYLPYYHMGVRASYKVNDALAVNYWITNGTDQTEPFNGFKDEFVGLTIQPTKKVNWNVNYYVGQEHPDVTFFANGGAPAGLPTEQGVPFEPIAGAPTGKVHIFDSYLT